MDATGNTHHARDGRAGVAASVAAWVREAEDLIPLPPSVFRIVRFLSVGVVGLTVDSGLFWSLFQAGQGASVARAISLLVATVVTWWLNRLVTFSPSGRSAGAEMIRYAAVALAAQGFNYVLFLSLLRIAPGVHPLIWLFTSAVLTAALSFTGQSLFAFARVRPSNAS